MGNPYEWYKLGLAYFVHALSISLSECEIFEEMSTEELEMYITEKRSQISEKAFYYCAGLAAAKMCADAGDTGCDAMNAAVGGLAQFEDFVGFDFNEVIHDE